MSPIWPRNDFLLSPITFQPPLQPLPAPGFGVSLSGRLHTRMDTLIKQASVVPHRMPPGTPLQVPHFQVVPPVTRVGFLHTAPAPAPAPTNPLGTGHPVKMPSVTNLPSDSDTSAVRLVLLTPDFVIACQRWQVLGKFLPCGHTQCLPLILKFQRLGTVPPSSLGEPVS